MDYAQLPNEQQQTWGCCACCVAGGLQLDRDVRALVAALSEMTSRTVRDKFARLTQVRRV
jgi:hypothetical protein